MAFLGLGFGFEAKDTNLLSFQKQVSAGFSDITTKMAELNATSAKASPVAITSDTIAAGFTKAATKMSETEERYGRFGKAVETRSKVLQAAFKGVWTTFEYFMSALRGAGKLAVDFGKLVVGGIAEKVGKMTDAVLSSNENLTTSFEAQAQHVRVTTKGMMANYGAFGDDLKTKTKDATKLFYQLGTSIEVNAQAVEGLSRSGGAFKAAGINTATLAKMATIYGIDVKELGDELGLVAKQTDAAFGSNILKKLYMAGRAMGDVGGAMKLMPQLSQQFQQNMTRMDPAQAKQYMEGTIEVLALSKKVAGSSAEAGKMAMAFTDNLVKSGRSFNALFSGVGTTLDKTSEKLGIVSGDFDGMKMASEKGPLALLKAFRETNKRLEKDGKTGAAAYFRQFTFHQLSETEGGAEVSAWLGRMMKLKDEDVAKVETSMKTVGTMTGKEFAKAIAEGFADSRTRKDMFELMSGQMVASLRAIAGPRVKSAMQSFRAATKQTIVDVKNLAASNGLAKDAIEKLSEVHQLGAVGMLPADLQGTGFALQVVAKELSPVMDTLGKLGISAKDLFSPTGLLTGGIVVASYLADKYGDHWDQFGKDFNSLIDDSMVKVANWTDKLAKIGPVIGRGLELALAAVSNWVDGKGNPLSPAAQRILSNLQKFGEPILNAFVHIFRYAFDKISDWLGKQDWSKTFNKVVGGISRAVQALTGKTPGDLVRGLGMMFYSAVSMGLGFAWDQLKTAASTHWVIALTGLLVGLPLAFAATGFIGSIGKFFTYSLTEGIGSGVNQLVTGSVGEKLGGRILDWMTNGKTGWIGKVFNGLNSHWAGKYTIFAAYAAKTIYDIEKQWDSTMSKEGTTGGKIEAGSKLIGESMLQNIPLVGGALDTMTKMINRWADHLNDVPRSTLKMVKFTKDELKHMGEVAWYDTPIGGAGPKARVTNRQQADWDARTAREERAADAAAQPKLQSPIKLFTGWGGGTGTSTPDVKAQGEEHGKEIGVATTDGFVKGMMHRGKNAKGVTILMKDMKDAFDTGTKEINNVLEPWFNKENAMFLGFAKSIEDVAKRISAAFANARIDFSTAKAVTEGRGMGANSSRLTKSAEVPGWAVALESATHRPDWAADYMTTFEAKMNDLIRKVEQLQGSTGHGHKSANRTETTPKERE